MKEKYILKMKLNLKSNIMHAKNENYALIFIFIYSFTSYYEGIIRKLALIGPWPMNWTSHHTDAQNGLHDG